MAIIKCGECGASISDMSYVCPKCGYDVRVLKNNGLGCRNCGHYDCERTYGPNGYPCLAYVEEDNYD